MRAKLIDGLDAGRWILLAAALLGFLGVAFGALGSHALSSILTDKSMHQYEIGVRYHFLHALALFGIGLLANQLGEGRWFNLAAQLMLVGVVLFSGSLYLLAISELRWLAYLTPVGGLLLLGGWGNLFWGVLRYHE